MKELTNDSLCVSICVDASSINMTSANAWCAFDELLINQVRENDIMYNKMNKDFKDAQLKKRTWKIIADAIGSTGLITVVYYRRPT